MKIGNLEIDKNTRLDDILTAYPWLKEELPKISEKFKLLDNPVGKMMLKKATIGDLISKAGIDFDDITSKLETLIKNHGK